MINLDKTFSGRRWSQDLSEFKSFIEFAQSVGVKSYLEIGARYGDSFHAMMTHLPKGSIGVAIDLPGAYWGKKGSADDLALACAHLNSCGYHAYCIFGDSQSQRVFNTLMKLDFLFDLVFIDGDHRYEAVKTDFDMYGNLAPYTAFHDINTSQTISKDGHKLGVTKLWNEIKQNHDYYEWINKNSEKDFGIGLLLND